MCIWTEAPRQRRDLAKDEAITAYKTLLLAYHDWQLYSPYQFASWLPFKNMIGHRVSPHEKDKLPACYAPGMLAQDDLLVSGEKPWDAEPVKLGIYAYRSASSARSSAREARSRGAVTATATVELWGRVVRHYAERPDYSIGIGRAPAGYRAEYARVKAIELPRRASDKVLRATTAAFPLLTVERARA